MMPIKRTKMAADLAAKKQYKAVAHGVAFGAFVSVAAFLVIVFLSEVSSAILKAFVARGIDPGWLIAAAGAAATGGACGYVYWRWERGA